MVDFTRRQRLLGMDIDENDARLREHTARYNTTPHRTTLRHTQRSIAPSAVCGCALLPQGGL